MSFASVNWKNVKQRPRGVKGGYTPTLVYKQVMDKERGI